MPTKICRNNYSKDYNQSSDTCKRFIKRAYSTTLLDSFVGLVPSIPTSISEIKTLLKVSVESNFSDSSYYSLDQPCTSNLEARYSEGFLSSQENLQASNGNRQNATNEATQGYFTIQNTDSNVSSSRNIIIVFVCRSILSLISFLFYFSLSYWTYRRYPKYLLYRPSKIYLNLREISFHQALAWTELRLLNFLCHDVRDIDYMHLQPL